MLNVRNGVVKVGQFGLTHEEIEINRGNNYKVIIIHDNYKTVCNWCAKK